MCGINPTGGAQIMLASSQAYEMFSRVTNLPTSSDKIDYAQLTKVLMFVDDFHFSLRGYCLLNQDPT